jgi:dynein heavy chain, axonemal
LRALSQVKADHIAAIESEMMLVGRIVRDMNLSKIDYRDEALFISLVNDVFPGFARQSAVKTSLYQSVDTAVHQVIDSTTGLVDHSLWTAKILQVRHVHDIVAHCVMIFTNIKKRDEYH